MSIRAVVSDVGGVLLRTMNPAPQRRWEKRLGLRDGQLRSEVFDSYMAGMATLGLATTEDVWNDLGKRLGLSAIELSELQRDFWSGDGVDGELVAFLQSLRPRYKVGLLTNAWPDARQSLRRQWGLADLADAIVVSAEERIAKPAPQIYRIMLDRLGARPQETVLVDDAMTNVEAARALGIRAIHFHNSEQVIRDVRLYLDQKP